jgi:hypothetical protein
MPAKASIVNQTLTNYARGVAIDKTSKLASFLAPSVPTGAASGQYKSFSDKNAFAVYNTARAVGGSRTRVEFDATDAYYNCKPNGLEIAIDDHERDQAGTNDKGGLQLERAKINTLISAQVISHELAVFTRLRAAVSATGGIGVWSNAANDPVAEIDSLIEAISNSIAKMPNRMVIGLGAWRVLKNHPKVLTRQPGNENIGVKLEQLSAMLLNPAMEIRIGVLPYDTTKPGKAASNANITGNEVWVFYGEENPSVYDASFAKTFRTDRSGVDTVKEYREEGASSDVYAVDWTEDVIVTAPIAGRRITLS